MRKICSSLTKKRVITFFMMVISILPSFSTTFEAEGINYKITSNTGGNNTVSVTKSNESDGYIGNIEIPTNVCYDGVTYTVTAIGESAFESNYPLTNIHLPSSISEISLYAFESCINLISVNLQETLIESVPMSCFENCAKLSSVSLPSTIQSLKLDCFKDCISLESVVLNEGLNTIDNSFSGCISLTSITLPNSVKTLSGAFFDCKQLKKIEITTDSQLEKIGSFCFTNCPIENIYLPSTLKEIGLNAFSSCESLESIEIPEKVIKLGTMAFYGCYNLQSITLPDNLSVIENRCFSYCKSLKEIYLPDGIIEISSGLLQGCGSLISVHLPNNLKILGDYAFEWCSELETINFPKSVTSFGKYAFHGCSSLTEIIFPLNLNTIGASCFYSTSLEKIFSPATNPPFLTSSEYESNYLFPKDATAYVRKSSLESYLNSDWKENVKEIIGSDIYIKVENSILSKNETEKLEVILLVEGDQNDIYWTSSNPEIITIDQNGNITAISSGSAEIKASLGQYQGSCIITVESVSAENIVLDTSELNLKVGEKYTLKALISPEDATDKTINWTSDKPNIAIVDEEGTVNAINQGECTITAKCGEVSDTCKVTVTLNSQTISWEQDFSNVTALDKIELTAYSSSGLTVDYSITQGNNIASIENNVLIISAGGEISITAFQSGDSTYDAADPITKIFTAQKHTQIIIWEQDLNNLIVGDVVELNATATSDLSVLYSISKGENLAKLEDNILTILGGGEMEILASQPGNETYKEAESISKPFTIVKKEQSIIWNQEFDELFVGDSVELTADASSGLDVEYTITDGQELASISGNTLTLLSAGAITVTATQQGNEAYQPTSLSKELTVNKRTQSLTWNQALDPLYVEDIVTLTAETSSGLEVEYSIIDGQEIASIEGNLLTILGAGDITIKASQPGNNEFEAAEPVSKKFTAIKKDQSIIWDQEFIDVIEGDEIELTAEASSGLQVEYAMWPEDNPSGDIILVTGNIIIVPTAGMINIEAYQFGNNVYEEAQPVRKSFVAQERNSLGSTMNDGRKVKMDGDNLVLFGFSKDEVVRIYLVNGTLIYSGTDRVIPLSPNQTYIVSYNGASVKLRNQ